jgi:RHS repeat-associated protein
MILFVPTAVPKSRRSRRARDFADLRKTADPRLEKRSLLVNLDKQPTVIHRPDGSQIEFTYDSAGRLATTTYPSVGGNVVVTRTYSPTTGQLTGVTTSDGQSLAYGYDGNLVTSTTWSGNVAGSIGKTYNNDFRVASQTVNGANSVSFGYDNDGLLTSVDGLTIVRDPVNGLVTDTTVGQVTDHRTYDSYGMLAAYEAKFGSTSLYSVSYVPDNLGRVEQRTETIQGTTTVWSYSYDSAGRLWQVMKDGVLSSTYLYDSNGNRLSKTTPSGTETATYDAQDRLLSYGNSVYTYDAAGNLQSKTDTGAGQVTTYSYDAQGNLRHVGLPDGRGVDYLVDSENRRVAKKVNGVLVRKWLYKDQLKPVAEFDGAGTLLARYLDGVTIKSGTSYRVVADHLGTPRLLVNSTSGTVAQRLDLNEWGQMSADSGVGFQVFGFAGGIYDPDTGLVRFGARDYDPVVGRWTAKDPIRFRAGDPNLYEYVFGDPINAIDPTGLDDNVAGVPAEPTDAGVPPGDGNTNSSPTCPDKCSKDFSDCWANCIEAGGLGDLLNALGLGVAPFSPISKTTLGYKPTPFGGGSAGQQYTTGLSALQNKGIVGPPARSIGRAGSRLWPILIFEGFYDLSLIGTCSQRCAANPCAPN